MTKQELRKLYIAKRKSYSDEDIVDFTKGIVDQLKTMNLQGLGSVFNAMTKMREVETDFILQEFTSCNWAYPKVNGNELRHFLINDRLQLGKGVLGITEPMKGDEITADQFDFVIVPLLVCDVKGNRVGFGKGYYDRFLSQCHDKCRFIAVNFFHPVNEIDGVHSSDIPIHYLVTPSDIISFV